MNSKKINTQFVGKKIIAFDTIDSTQIYAKKLAEQGESEGTCVVSAQQTQGRGRFNRPWYSDRGGLWFSLILRPVLSPHQAGCISLSMALAVAETIENFCNLKIYLKWPNDIIFLTKENQYKKCGGILTDLNLRGTAIDWLVIGVGMNVNNIIPLELETKAISLKMILEKEVNRSQFFEKLLCNIEKQYLLLIQNNFHNIKLKYLSYHAAPHQEIIILNGEIQRKGTFHDISDEGALLLRTENNQIEKFFAGEITFSI